MEERNGYEPSGGIPVTAGGELRLSPELFTHMIKNSGKGGRVRGFRESAAYDRKLSACF